MQRSFVALHIHGKFHRGVGCVFIDFKIFSCNTKKSEFQFFSVFHEAFSSQVTEMLQCYTMEQIYETFL